MRLKWPGAVVLVVDEIGGRSDRAADDVVIAVAVEIGGGHGGAAGGAGETSPGVVGQLADAPGREVEVPGSGIPEQENLVLADGQDIDVAVMVDVDGEEVVGRPVRCRCPRPGSGP